MLLWGAGCVNCARPVLRGLRGSCSLFYSLIKRSINPLSLGLRAKNLNLLIYVQELGEAARGGVVKAHNLPVQSLESWQRCSEIDIELNIRSLGSLSVVMAVEGRIDVLEMFFQSVKLNSSVNCLSVFRFLS